MASEKADEVNAFVRVALLALLARPTGEFRQRAWRTFERALDRHAAGKRHLRPVQPQR